MEWKMMRSSLWIYENGCGEKHSLFYNRQGCQMSMQAQPNSTYVFFYCDFRESAKQNVRGKLSSLPIQLSAQSDVCDTC
ncbi:hypothetical protein OBBRIDRAFT_793226 [Obba rivulosa]|uniref:Uncharacterized protein n=1 Tax=Obba rivulosa TaxID=1052685 RepID=A0A8E2ATZ1_9APHY|nr:hypothetical protein OBBRIDRAFT_793226 [Obba rivulosa]